MIKSIELFSCSWKVQRYYLAVQLFIRSFALIDWATYRLIELTNTNRLRPTSKFHRSINAEVQAEQVTDSKMNSISYSIELDLATPFKSSQELLFGLWFILFYFDYFMRACIKNSCTVWWQLWIIEARQNVTVWAATTPQMKSSPMWIKSCDSYDYTMIASAELIN